MGLLHLPLGAAVLLGASLAPTNPVLTSDVQAVNQHDRDRLRFGLRGEGGTDGAAFSLVMLELLPLHELGEWGWRWWAVEVLWAVAEGGICFAQGALVGRLVLHLHSRRRETTGAAL